MSVGDLRRQGFTINLGGRSTLEQGGVHVDIEECDGLFFLEAKPSQELRQQCAVVVPSPRMRFIEWCCEPDSRLTTWLATRGCTATRLHLPHDDMRRQDSAERVLKEVREPWQQVNLQTGKHSAELIMAAREESKGMLQKACWVLRQVLGPARQGQGQVHAVYEWPRGAYAATAGMEEMEEIMRLMPHICAFDGCRYGLRARSGVPMRKPWRVHTTMIEMQAVLNKRCDQSHPHQTTRGEDAAMSGRYTAELARAAGEALMQKHGSAPREEVMEQEVEARLAAVGEEIHRAEEESGDDEIDVDARQAENRLRWAEPQPERAAPIECEVRRREQQTADPVERDVRRGVPGTAEPRPEERARHELTHTPYGEWCYECVSGRGKDTAHRKAKKTPEGPPIVQLDYPFMRQVSLRTTSLRCCWRAGRVTRSRAEAPTASGVWPKL